MNDTRLGWAIAGTGGIARRFAADMRLAKRGRVVAVASVTPERAARLAAAIGPDVASGDLDAVLRDPRVGAIYLAGRNDDHCPQALRCLAAGRPVLIEKPIATTTADAERVRRAAADANVLAMEAMWMRFTPGIRRLKALVDTGAIGAVRSIEASLSFRNAAPQASPLLDLGVYPASLAVQLLGSPDRIAALSADAGDAGVVLSYPNAIVSLRCGFSAEGSNILSVTGETGIIATGAPFFCPSFLTIRRSRGIGPASAEVGLPPPTRLAWLASAKSLLRPLRERRIPTLYRGTGLHYQAEHFAECVEQQIVDSPVMPLAESVEVIRIVEAADAAADRSTALEKGQRLEA